MFFSLIDTNSWCQQLESLGVKELMNERHIEEKITARSSMQLDSKYSSFVRAEMEMLGTNTSHELALKYLCNACNKTFITSGGLYKHRKIAHGRAEDLIPCPQCEQKFVTQSALNRHISKHSNDRPFVCSNCGKSYKTKYALNSHPCR